MSGVDRSSLPGAEERALLRESLRGFLESRGSAGRNSDDAAASLWDGLVGQGLAGLGADPETGGLRELAIVMEELGRAAAPVPALGAALVNLALRAEPTASPIATRLLERVQTGDARVAMSLGELDPDPQTASLDWRGEALCGSLRFVDAAGAATDLVVATPDGLAVVDLRHAGARVTPTRALGTAGWSEITLDQVPAESIAIGDERLAALRLAVGVLLIARAHGAARRAFEMVVDYAKERRQFGQPIGRFQAIQHKLADNLIALEGVRLTIEHAAEAFDFGLADFGYFAEAAIAFAGTALRKVALETQHAFGAIGYAEEHEAPRHFRRVHLDTVVLGGARVAREALAARLLARDDARSIPEYDLGPAGNAFRDEVRAWLAEHWSGARKAAFDAKPFHDREFDPSFARDLGTTGWLGLAWPREFGGQARSPLEQLAFIEVMERAEAPRIGASVQANALIMHGSAEQKRRYLPEILRGEAMHGMGYSEPDSGSDLASLRTSAVRDGDQWVINGQKIWTTTYWGKYMFLAARTDRDAKPPHAGISMFIVPMDTPGITVKPAATMYDGSFANIFYDGVRIPLDAIVGPVNGGWKVLTDALANERGLIGGGIVLKVAHGFEGLCSALRANPALRDDPLVRDRIGQLAAEIEVGRRLMIHCAELATGGTTPPEMGAISKVFSGELMERYGEAALDLLGPRAALSQDAPGALANGRFEQQLRHSLMWVISIGTNEIQRSLIAQRGLGLPR
ncbi:acyl-CoA dehydrogenase [Piscinibacter koreensis]|uniref:Acyl-CoA dehydrogenase n=1 Tax=Piscinibacter koreensis TaxID=2742824 RepID=A0A7Y6TV54_9BURK|nr:acyl-CoA dehydrogenase [Schlegelella koreensis]NUZ04729.1 acyl-CoA dehydrogenase [Schlegelella koreensis]